jgi:dipeptidyl-peptidase-4
MKWPLGLIGLLAITSVCADPAHTPAFPTLTRLYSLPWVVGTTPEKPAWSPDSRHVAFLWSDEGSNTRDLWWTTPEDASPIRLTQVAHPVAPPNADPQLTLKDVDAHERDPGITAFAFTGDGSALVYSREGALYRAPTASHQDSSRVVSHAPGAHDLVPVPGSAQIVYADAQGVHVLILKSGAPVTRSLASVEPDVAIESLRVSPDGRWVAFLETDSRPIRQRLIPDYLTPETQAPSIRRAFPGEPSEHYRVGVVAVSGGETVWMQMDGNPEDLVFGLAFSPDSHALLIDRGDLYIKHRWIRILDPRTGVGATVYEERDPGNVTAEWWADFAPDGQRLFITSDRGDDYQLWEVPLDGRPPAALTDGRSAVFAAAVVPQARGILYIANTGRSEDRTPYFQSFTGQTVPLSRAHGHHEPIASPDGRWLAEVDSDDGTPPELYVRPLDPSGAAPAARRVTHSPQPGYEGFPWSVARYVDFPNVHDGTSVHARMTLPPDFDPQRRYPAILGSVYSNTAHNRFGGRIYHPTWALDQVLAHHGYIVLNVDISGSSGHGKAFRQRIREDYGGVDVEDLYSATRYLVGTGVVDERRIGIWGSSYGGLLTTMSLMKHPGVYAAGVAGAPATNVFHAETGEMRTMMDPLSRADRYRAASPYLYSGQLRDPLLFIHGMRDDTVLFKDTLTLAQRLILDDKDFEIAVLPDAPHGWDTQGLAQTRYAFRRLVEFFDRHLQPAPADSDQRSSR